MWIRLLMNSGWFWREDNKDEAGFVRAKHKDLKQEILYGLCNVDKQVWNAIVDSVRSKLDTKAARNILSHHDASMDGYHLEIGVPIDQPHLLSLKLYTDLTKLCAAFCTILRRGDPVEVAQIAHWTLLLVETVQGFGTTLDSKTYFRGVSQKFFFPQIVTQFNLPNSTTSSVECDLSHWVSLKLLRFNLKCLHFMESEWISRF